MPRFVVRIFAVVGAATASSVGLDMSFPGLADIMYDRKSEDGLEEGLDKEGIKMIPRAVEAANGPWMPSCSKGTLFRPSFYVVQSRVCGLFAEVSPTFGFVLAERVIDVMWKNNEPKYREWFRAILTEAIEGLNVLVPLFVPGIIDKLEALEVTDLALNERTIEGLFVHTIVWETRVDALDRMFERLRDSSVLNPTNQAILKASFDDLLLTKTRTTLIVYTFRKMNLGDQFFRILQTWNVNHWFTQKILGIRERFRFFPDLTFGEANRYAPCAMAYLVSNNYLKSPWVDAILPLAESLERGKLSYAQLKACRPLIEGRRRWDRSETSFKVIQNMIRLYSQEGSEVTPGFKSLLYYPGLLRDISKSDLPDLFRNILNEMSLSHYPIPYWKSGVIAALSSWHLTQITGMFVDPATIAYFKKAILNGEEVRAAHAAMLSSGVFAAEVAAQLDQVLKTGGDAINLSDLPGAHVDQSIQELNSLLSKLTSSQGSDFEHVAREIKLMRSEQHPTAWNRMDEAILKAFGDVAPCDQVVMSRIDPKLFPLKHAEFQSNLCRAVAEGRSLEAILKQRVTLFTPASVRSELEALLRRVEKSTLPNQMVSN